MSPARDSDHDPDHDPAQNPAQNPAQSPAQSPAQCLVDALPLAAILVTPDERIAVANAQARALLEPAPAGLHYITALRQPDVLDAIQRCADTGASTRALWLARDAGARDITLAVTCAWLDLPAIAGVLASFEDRSHLEQAGAARRDFVANVSHELRTPLTSLLGFIETLRGPAAGDAAAQARFLDIMEGEALRMERLVSDLLSLSRVEAQERMRPTGDVDLAALVRSVAHGLAPQAAEAGVTIETDLPEGAAIVPGDDDQLRQVIGNLVENAIKYGWAGGAVRLALGLVAHSPALRAPAAEITVSDSGEGIDAIHLPRLTERFYRVDSHRSRAVGGTGLGLAIVKHVVNRHRGRLQIESTPGAGSAFRVILPRAPT